MVSCNKCGGEVPATAKFCPNCAAPVPTTDPNTIAKDYGLFVEYTNGSFNEKGSADAATLRQQTKAMYEEIFARRGEPVYVNAGNDEWLVYRVSVVIERHTICADTRARTLKALQSNPRFISTYPTVAGLFRQDELPTVERTPLDNLKNLMWNCTSSAVAKHIPPSLQVVATPGRLKTIVYRSAINYSEYRWTAGDPSIVNDAEMGVRGNTTQVEGVGWMLWLRVRRNTEYTPIAFFNPQRGVLEFNGDKRICQTFVGYECPSLVVDKFSLIGGKKQVPYRLDLMGVHGMIQRIVADLDDTGMFHRLEEALLLYKIEQRGGSIERL